MEDFICAYDNILDEDLIDQLKSIIDHNINYVANSDSIRQDKQLTIEPFLHS